MLTLLDEALDVAGEPAEDEPPKMSALNCA
jgi:hypothetical protein